jgi:hypothetical protein
MNLYLVVLQGATMFKSYVVAENPDLAYCIVRAELDKNYYGSIQARELDYVQLLTHEYVFGEPATRLFVQERVGK